MVPGNTCCNDILGPDHSVPPLSFHDTHLVVAGSLRINENLNSSLVEPFSWRPSCISLMTHRSLKISKEIDTVAFHRWVTAKEPSSPTWISVPKGTGNRGQTYNSMDTGYLGNSPQHVPFSLRATSLAF